MPAPKLIRCQHCRLNLFAPRFAGQKSGGCDECNRERRRQQKLRRKPKALTDEQNDLLRRLERMTVKVGR